MKWETANLKDISIIKTGKLNSNAAVSGGKYPFFTCDPQTLNIDVWAYDTEAVLLAGNNASGNYTAKYYNGKFNAYQRTYIIESFDKTKLNVRFLCYAMNLQLRLLKSMSSGSTTKFLTIKMLQDLNIPFPEIGVQNRVTAILSAYDNLIENNQKQIKLLEEAAQRLYKEWFVDLHFPGYESAKIVDGVPDGWKKSVLGEITPIITGKKDANFGTTNGVYPFFTCSQEPIKAPSYSFDTNAVILAGNGDFNVKLYRGRFEAYQRTYVLSPYDEKHLYILFYALKNNMNILIKGASGSTIKFLTTAPSPI